VLELAILGLLKEQDLHGYELKKRLGEMLGVASGVSFGSLYPALGRLERSGAVRTVESPAAESPGRPDILSTGSLGGELAAWRARPSATRSAPRAGRSRKVYGITAHGEALFEELLAAEQSTGDDSRLFHLRLAFARYLSAEARLGMLERRRVHLLERLTRPGPGTRTGRRIDTYVRSLMDHDRESAEHDLSWIDRLIARERAGAAPVDTPTSPAPPSPAEPHSPAHLSPAHRRAETPAPAPAGPGITGAVPKRGIAPPTLSGLRPIAITPPGPPPGGRQQEESTR
jgi:DNA-binding PadR family transcriptional regulator